ncbi:MAG TPA: hypothetical protein VD971_08720 [Phycisphaerales bacterium]|nr:hypothetical protein [Phycisphaerales bacterium]
MNHNYHQGGRAEHDALADLFLSSADASTPADDGGPALRLRERARRDASPAPAHVEAVILGHLPVLAGAWVTQYARATAEAADSPVSLLRLQSGSVCLDVIYPGRRDGAGAAPFSRFDAAVAHARTQTARFLVRVDEADEPDVLAWPGLSSVTLLTGADSPAVLASYQSLKEIGRRLEASGRESLAVRLAIMGASDADAARAEAKIARACREFLRRDLPAAVRVQRIGATISAALYRAPQGLGLTHTLDALLTPAAPAPPALEHERNAQPRPAVSTAAPPKPLDEMPAPAVVVETEPAPRPPADAATVSPLASLVAGLTHLERGACPVAPAVELAAGASGELHLLVRARGVAGAGDLLAAASWAAQHEALLKRAYPALAHGHCADGPHLHVITDDVRAVRPLLDTALHVHLVVERPGAVAVN